MRDTKSYAAKCPKHYTIHNGTVLNTIFSHSVNKYRLKKVVWPACTDIMQRIYMCEQYCKEHEAVCAVRVVL